MADFNCAYCGKYGYGKPGSGPMSSSSSPSGWVQNKLFGFGIKHYCSKKCKQADEGNVQNNSDKSIAFNHTFKEAEKIKAQEEAYRLREEQRNNFKEKLELKINDIASLDFGNSKESITNTLDQLVVVGSSKPTPKERKAIFDKMEIGIMKLQKIGENDNSFYEEKMKKIKPNFWHKMVYYFENN